MVSRATIRRSAAHPYLWFAAPRRMGARHKRLACNRFGEAVTFSEGFFVGHIALWIVLTDKVVLPATRSQTTAHFGRVSPHELTVMADGLPISGARNGGKRGIHEILLLGAPDFHKTCECRTTCGPGGEVLAGRYRATMHHGVNVIRQMLGPTLRSLGELVGPNQGGLAHFDTVLILRRKKLGLLSIGKGCG